jgi:hypothetical protein
MSKAPASSVGWVTTLLAAALRLEIGVIEVPLLPLPLQLNRPADTNRVAWLGGSDAPGGGQEGEGEKVRDALLAEARQLGTGASRISHRVRL